jgi:hypothetical protein
MKECQNCGAALAENEVCGRCLPTESDPAEWSFEGAVRLFAGTLFAIAVVASVVYLTPSLRAAAQDLMSMFDR